jgi:hypothetical protein
MSFHQVAYPFGERMPSHGLITFLIKVDQCWVVEAQEQPTAQIIQVDHRLARSS